MTGGRLAWGGTILVAAILFAIDWGFQDQNVWQGWTESAEFKRPRYAESVHRQQVIRTRANTWSNLIYVLIGLYAVSAARDDFRQQSTQRRGYLIENPAMSLLFGVACCYLGIGSGVFHASLTRWGQQLDVAAMYSPILVLIAISFGRWWPSIGVVDSWKSAPTWPILAGVVFTLSVLFYQYKWAMSSLQVMTTLILIVGFCAVLDQFSRAYRMQPGWIGLALLSLVAGIICREMDLAGRFSPSDSWFQGHAIWHLLTGLSLASALAYQRLEKPAAAKSGLLDAEQPCHAQRD